MEEYLKEAGMAFEMHENYEALWKALTKTIGGNPERICAFGIVDGFCPFHDASNCDHVLADIEETGRLVQLRYQSLNIPLVHIGTI